MKESYQYHHQGQVIHYQIRRTRRRSLGVYIYPDRRVQVRGPLKSSARSLHQYLASSAPWIISQLEQLPESSAPVEQLCLQGAQRAYLGQWYEVSTRQAQPQGVLLNDQGLLISSKEPDDPLRNESVLKAWYRKQAAVVFAERLAVCRELMQAWDLPVSELKLRWMKARWGSCSRSGVITLNLELIKKDLASIDYVIVHELCHLREFNHSPAFYAMMSSVIPDWKLRKRFLETG